MKDLKISIPSLEVRIATVKDVKPLPNQPNEYWQVTTTDERGFLLIPAEKSDMIKGLSKPGAKILIVTQGEAYKLIYGPLEEKFTEQY